MAEGEVTDADVSQAKRGLLFFCCVICCFLPLMFGPSVFFVVAGVESLDADCLQDDSDGDSLFVDLAVWLIVIGAIPLGVFVLGLIGACVAKCQPNMEHPAIIPMQRVMSIVCLGWTGYGIYILVESDDCHDTNPFLYNSALAAIILTLLGSCGFW
eukprot:CAMPEP_0201540494 /NCGR_PEP_ID=MMETSP0161_2-20130828/70966_1 /ASSEMBLY_ACC=CAM_ASM_000251 /TAXON_ID=180227 /ORGANISM="Neoparamoeba aestuarina, Strain SoJaBio B1-5/56/2" /LENGTH=155 /DNA_ID=CAMNT_0047947965 /DNA_START=144 /DNA_END=608 /DNA_ORIENTATION=+